MYDLLVRLVVLAALWQLGIEVKRDVFSFEPSSRIIQVANRNVLQIPWRPITVFHKEAARFQ